MKKNGFSLKYASNNLKKYHLICLEAIKNNIDAFHFIDISLKNDKIENLIFDEGSLYIL